MLQLKHRIKKKSIKLTIYRYICVICCCQQKLPLNAFSPKGSSGFAQISPLSEGEVQAACVPGRAALLSLVGCASSESAIQQLDRVCSKPVWITVPSVGKAALSS